ncbi:hypothetical protein PYCCODRAFT_1200522 [Trametes coccinea BRFM310]|uniref:F-box domain-containing protein n=1 Tax=Trametes coccinea (strain BRFM310) TaxID=1353009 RepID=A0A1Y2I7H9_TRAC3|nr:hypothetical protein PYCCODRAFT_1200522 [Trametes coccinea BRFM310]
MPTQDMFRVLNADCLARIYVEARQLRALRSLSMTCKSIRKSCMDILFERCHGYIVDDRLVHWPPPPTLWPHIQQLNYYGSVEDPVPELDWRAPETLPAERLARMLRAMPRLRGITVSNTRTGDGISWAILQAILSTPQLRSFEVKGRMYRAYDRLRQTKLDFAPLESFRYHTFVYSKPPRIYSEEKELLSNILSKLSSTLVTLILPAECISIDTLRGLDWPKLREIQFAGDGQGFCVPDADLVSILGRVPRLRALSLDFAIADRSQVQAYWPARAQHAEFPWPELGSLALTWVHPEENIFHHLPATCRRLSLRSWPRAYNHYRMRGNFLRDIRWRLRLLSPPVILEALQECCDLPLEHLELEYRASSDDIGLLAYVARTFTRLRTLRLIRYRPLKDNAPVPVKDVVEQFSVMQNLRVLELYLDLENVTLQQRRPQPYEEFCRELDAALTDIAPTLCSSLVSLCLITMDGDGPARWRYYRPVRVPGSSTSLVFDFVHHEIDYLRARPSW